MLRMTPGYDKLTANGRRAAIKKANELGAKIVRFKQPRTAYARTISACAVVTCKEVTLFV